MGHWIGWDNRIMWFNIVLGLIIFCIVKVERIKLKYNKQNVLSYLFLISAYLFLNGISLTTVLFYCLPLFSILLLNNDDRINCFHFIYKWFALLMIPSIIAYLMYRIGGLPSVGRIMVSSTDVTHPLWYLLRDNHLVLVTFVLRIEEDTSRFCSMFIEPGHLAMISAFLLYAGGFNFSKKTTWVIFIATILTMSLTGFLLTFIGYLLYKYVRGEIKIKFVVVFLLSTFIVVLFGLLYNNGNNLFNEYILSRLEPDADTGIAGNNRVFGQIDLYFATMFSDVRLLLFGYDKNTIDSLLSSGSGGAGIQFFLVCNGFIGLIAAFSIYACYYLFCENKRLAFAFFFFVFILFLQRSYWDWMAWIICYIYGLTYYERSFVKNTIVKSIKNDNDL